MNIGILKEDTRYERRVALTPAAVLSLVENEHSVYIEQNAGFAARFKDEEYEKVGARIVYTSDEVFGRSEILLKISPLAEMECSKLSEGQVLFSFLHLAISRNTILKSLLEKGICSIGYELIEDEKGNLPVLQEMSEIAGMMSIQIAARYLESTNNGRGIVLGGITGIPPATVVVLGAGTVGSAAVRMAIGAGAEVIVLDKDLNRLRILENRFNYRITTGIANYYNIKKALQFADVVVGAVLLKGERAPHLITEDIVKQMKAGSIIVDVSIDQGGCVATSHPTTFENPTFIVHDVIHYCVPNIPASVARTATYGLTNALLPYVLEIAEKGIDRALHENIGLSRGLCTFNELCTNEAIARRFDVQHFDIHSLLNKENVL
ncbi:MAG: alanine dehydrogenase [Ignavibacteriales bacterium]|nr:alanine dehydrogenase [Ignavibacteriales bacterium]